MVLQINFTFKPFPSTCKREREREKERAQRTKRAREREECRSANQTSIQPTPVTPSSPHRRSFSVVRSPSFRKTHSEFSFHLWPIQPLIHTSPHCRSTVTEPHLRKTHKSDPHTSRIQCAFYIYIYLYKYLYNYLLFFI